MSKRPARKPAADSPETAAAKKSRARASRSRKKPPADARSAPATPRAAIIVPEVSRTGSADRHLATDEEVAPPPVSRPRSYRDLDAIPDDYD